MNMKSTDKTTHMKPRRSLEIWKTKCPFRLLRTTWLLAVLVVAAAPGDCWSEDNMKPVFSLKVSEGNPPVVEDQGSWAMPVELVQENGPEPSFTASPTGGYLCFPEGSQAGILLKDSEIVKRLGRQFTISLWVNPNFEDSRFAELVSVAGDGGEEKSFRLRFSGYSESLAFSTGGNKPAFSIRTDPNTIPLKTWTHIAVVSDESHAILYINGKPSAETPLNGADLTPQLGKNQFLTLGNYISRKDCYAFVGDLAGIQFFDHALEASHIQQLASESPSLK
jgi:hypothetical protein